MLFDDDRLFVTDDGTLESIEKDTDTAKAM